MQPILSYVAEKWFPYSSTDIEIVRGVFNIYAEKKCVFNIFAETTSGNMRNICLLADVVTFNFFREGNIRVFHIVDCDFVSSS